MLSTTDRRFKHYKANEDRIILKDGLLFRKYYGETGSVKYYQILTPKQLVNEVLRNLNGEFEKHPGLTETIIAYREKLHTEVAGVLGITLKHATTKHAQTTGLLGRSHASVKQALKTEKGEPRSLWHKYISIAVPNYNVSYHSSIGCEPSRVFYGRIPYNMLDLKMGIRP